MTKTQVFLDFLIFCKETYGSFHCSAPEQYGILPECRYACCANRAAALALSVLSSFGRNAVLNLDYQRANRVVGMPFHFLDLVQSMNVRPLNYSWTEFYDRLVDVFEYTFSRRALVRRLVANGHLASRVEQLFRGVSAEWRNRIAYHRKMRGWLDEPDVRGFFEGETNVIPARFVQTIRRHLGPMWEWLPDGALYHDPNAFLNSGTDHPLARATTRAPGSLSPATA